MTLVDTPLSEADVFDESQPLKRLSLWHEKLIELCLDGKLNNTQMAQLLGKRRETVGLIIKTPIFQNELSRRRLEQQKKIDTRVSEEIGGALGVLNRNAENAANTIVSLLNDLDSRVQLTAAKEILDRSGIGVQREGQMPVIHINGDRVQVLLAALKESRSFEEPSAVDVAHADAFVGVADAQHTSSSSES